MPGNGQAFLGMPGKETLDILTINCNTTEMQTQTEQIYNKEENEWQYTQKTCRKNASLSSAI